MTSLVIRYSITVFPWHLSSSFSAKISFQTFVMLLAFQDLLVWTPILRLATKFVWSRLLLHQCTNGEQSLSIALVLFKVRVTDIDFITNIRHAIFVHCAFYQNKLNNARFFVGSVCATEWVKQTLYKVLSPFRVVFRYWASKIFHYIRLCR